MDEESSPTTIGPYEILRRLGHGGAGVVYAARDPRLGRDVALKLLKFASPEDARRFEREERILARLKHPGIVGIFDVGEANGQPFFVMELVVGASLAEALDSDLLTRREAVEVVRQAAEAVAFAHGQGVIHRDLKPGNLLVTQEKKARVMDFGLAKLAEGKEEKLSLSGVALGTPAYMSPEQASGAWNLVDERTDVWGLGATLYHVLAGSPPFGGGSFAETVDAIRSTDPRRPRSVDPTVDPDVETICLKALEKEPFRRYATAGAMAEDLRRYLAGEPILARPPSAAYRVRRWIVRKRVWAGLAAALALAAGAAVWGATTIQRSREFERARVEARRAFESGNWSRAKFESDRALRLRSDAELQRISSESATRLAEAAAEKDEARRYRELEETKIKPLLGRIQETRTFFYLERVDLRGRLDALETELEDLERIGGEHADVWILAGIGWYFAGDSRRAERMLLRAEKLAPDDGRVHFYLGRIYLERWRTVLVMHSELGPEDQAAREKELEAKTLARMKRVAEGWAGATEIERHLARAYYTLVDRRVHDMKKVAEEGLRRFGEELGSEEFWMILSWTREPKEREEAVTQAIRRRPHYAWAHLQRSHARRMLQDLAGELADLDKAVEQNPRLIEAFSNRGVARRKRGDLEGSFADFGRALRLDPDHVPALVNRGGAWLEQGDYARARADFDAALRIHPRVPAALSNRAALSYMEGDLERAQADVDECLRIHPWFANGWLTRGLIRFSRDLEGAFSDFTEALRHNPDLVEAYVNRAVCWQRKNEPDRAIADFTEALRRDPRHASAWCGRAKIWYGKKETEKAFADLAQALRVNPRLVEAYRFRGDLYYVADARAECLSDYRKALRLAPANWKHRAELERRVAELEKQP